MIRYQSYPAAFAGKFFHDGFISKYIILIGASKGAKPHAESMAKMVFKPNGDIVAVYEVDTPSDVNPFSGEIHYVHSSDGGASWSVPAPVHQDVSAHAGRGFFDAVLRNKLQ